MKALHELKAVTLTDYSEVARSVGLNPDQLLKGVEIDPAMLRDPESRLPAASVAQLLEDSARLSGSDSFGILMAQRRSFKSLGPFMLVLERLSSIREVVNAIIGKRRHLYNTFELGIEDRPDRCLITVTFLPHFAVTQAVNQVTANIHVVLNGASRGSWHPKLVHFRHNAPREIDAFEQFFGAPIRFNSDMDGFECERDDLDRRWEVDPIIAAADLLSILEVEVDSLLHEPVTYNIIRELQDILAKIRTQMSGLNES